MTSKKFNKANLIIAVTISFIGNIFSVNATTTEEESNIKIFENSVGSVVHVSNIAIANSIWSLNPIKIPRGSGTGIVWDKEGHIVTNYHVIDGGDIFLISFHKDNKQYRAKIAGAAPQKDIAILKLEELPPSLKPLTVGSSDKLRVGQKAIAIGNPFGLDHSMSMGIISALNRKIPSFSGEEIDGMIQTDASINPGNSGGPLLDSDGSLIGINTMIFSQSGSSAGVGFAVPVNLIKSIVPQLVAHGRIVRPKMEMTIMPASVAGIESGVIVESILEGGAADKAGLKGITRSRQTGRIFLGDLITKIDGKPVDVESIYRILDNLHPGDTMKIEYLRDGKSTATSLKLSK